MFLKRFVFVNWGNVPDGEFDLGPVNLFSGANGSGKTTAADAIQTVMTAAHENLFHFNPGQDESSQRGRGGKRVRTLSSYILGCDDGSYARLEATDGYLAAVFHPTKEETAEPFTAVVGVRAWLDQSGKQALSREEMLLFLILPNVELNLGAFVRDLNGVRHIVLLDEIQQSLITRFGKRSVERYDQKRAYLRRLYGALRGKPDSVSERESMAAARAFSRFMAYKPVSSINQFVAEEVLERRDLGEAIRSVSSQLKLIHGMEREAQGLKDSAALLERASTHALVYLGSWVELETLSYARARAAFLTWQARYQRTSAARDAARRDLEENAAQLLLAEERAQRVHAALVNAEAQRQGVPALQQKDALEKERQGFDRDLSRRAVDMLEQGAQLETNLRSVQALTELLGTPSFAADLPQVTDLEARRIVRQAHEARGNTGIDLPRILQRDLTNDLQMLEKHLDDAAVAQRAQTELVNYWLRREAGESRRDQVSAAHQLRRQRYEHCSSQIQQKRQEIARLEAKQAVYPAYAERALAAIRAQYPQADARILCDHIDVADPRWQSSIEGYMGGARFGIIVDEQYEAQAIQLVRSLPGRDNRARVIQGTKALRDASRIKLPPESIVHILKFSHRIAQAYVTASYGAVVRVESAEELRQTARGITADGMGCGNYTLFRCDIADADLVFGAGARERALRARQLEVDRWSIDRQEANTRMQESARLLDAVSSLAPLHFADSLAALLALHREIRRVEVLLAGLDLSQHASLEADLAMLREQEREARLRSGDLLTRKGDLNRQLANLLDELERLRAEKDAAETRAGAAAADLRRVHSLWPEFDLDAHMRDAEIDAQALDPARAEITSNEISGRLRRSEHALGTTILEHNQKCRPADAVVYTTFVGNYDAALFASLGELRREIDRIYNILKNNVLVDKHEQLKMLKKSFNDAFVSHLCQEIHQSILNGTRQLDLLNKELVGHRFGSDREQFRFAQEWLPEYREYARFFEEVVRNPAIGEEATLFDAPLSPKSLQVRDSLMGLLLGTDEQKSMRELERIADYRNFHRYEIYKEVEGKPPIALSEYGTGSGGQLETPAYIIRAASITSALRYSEGNSHLRMVLVDEAFSKMDENRSREVIGYLTRTLGLQLIFIMPTSKCGPFMDLISNDFVFAKVPSAPRGQLLTRVLVDRKECNQTRIGELWAQHRRTVLQQAELEFMSDVLP
ncbi:MAG: hypothetical protein M3O41_14560 [Pseudomonadota bacterium]|nr:hypothetical protein [Pseudomonadota bacterium]